MPLCFKCNAPIIFLTYDPNVTRLSFRDLRGYTPPKELPIDRDPSAWGTLIVYEKEIPWYEGGFSRRKMTLYRRITGIDLHDARRDNRPLYTCHYDTCRESPDEKRRRSTGKKRVMMPANFGKKKVSESDLAVKHIYAEKPTRGIWCYSYRRNEGHTPDGARCGFHLALLNATWDVYIEYKKQFGVIIERPPNITGKLIAELTVAPKKTRKKKADTR